jgi:ribosomal protein L7Ae-like RNA K-turn-binding protein
MARAKRMKIEEIRGLLGLARRAGRLSIGSRETRVGLRRGEIRLVLLAGDSSPRDRERLARVAAEESVPARVVGSRASLGEAIGRDGVAVVGVRDPNMAEALEARLGAEGGPGPSPPSGGRTR